jgi:hypothetical protein
MSNASRTEAAKASNKTILLSDGFIHYVAQMEAIQSRLLWNLILLRLGVIVSL